MSRCLCNTNTKGNGLCCLLVILFISGNNGESLLLFIWRKEANVQLAVINIFSVIRVARRQHLDQYREDVNIVIALCNGILPSLCILRD